MAFNHKHLIDITEYSEEDIKLILETAKAFSEVNERAIKKVPTLKGKTIVNMFNEPSTRTRSSFELAEKRLSADSLNFGGSSTSTVKGESLVDTVETLNAYKIDCIVVRDKHAGAPYIVTQNSPASVICAGDGKHNHPTQALLDRWGASQASADARDDGGVWISEDQKLPDVQTFYSNNGNGMSMLSHYVYNMTNVRLRELSIGYDLPSKWFNDKVGMTVSLVGRNLWMIYNKAPFDPEITASTGTYYQGLDYFMQPSTRTFGFSVRLQF